MNKQTFLAVIDTTEERRPINVPKGIINTYLVKAVDENHARQIILRTMIPQIANQLVNHVYVYPIQPILDSIDYADETGKTLPMFSFMPLNGTRPPKVLLLPDMRKQDQSAEKTEADPQEPTKEPQPATVVPKRTVIPPVVQPKNVRQVRSVDFQRPDYQNPPTTSNTLTPEQAQIIHSMGALPLANGSDEGANPRINSSIGRNANLSRPQVSRGPSDSLTPEQAALLRSVGVNETQPILVEEKVAYPRDGGSPLVEPDPELAAIPKDAGGVDLDALQAEYRDMVELTGMEVPDSKPITQIEQQPAKQTRSSKKGK